MCSFDPLRMIFKAHSSSSSPSFLSTLIHRIESKKELEQNAKAIHDLKIDEKKIK